MPAWRSGDRVHQRLDCTSCHGGDAAALKKEEGHRGMMAHPGRMDVAQRSCGACHADAVKTVSLSMMNTARGMVSVNRFSFGEAKDPDGRASFDSLGDSPADRHFKQLCSNCHLGHEPTALSPNGGGCNACHAQAAPRRDEHPAVLLPRSDEVCFGCHAGSGRVSLSFRGWRETDESGPSATRLEELERAHPAGVRLLPGDRVAVRVRADVHAERGMGCMDCHTVREIMGDGVDHAHKEDAQDVACTDCHAAKPRSVPMEKLDARSQGLLRMRGTVLPPGSVLAVTAAHGSPLLGTRVVKSDVQVQTREGSRVLEARAPNAACSSGNHARLSCDACHASAAPQCIGCHTQEDAAGKWEESVGNFLWEPPVLGMDARHGLIRTYVPGMVMTLRARGDKADRLVRLHAPLSPHTTTRASRTCASCHQEPLAVGLGRGTLKYAPSPSVAPGFTPRFERLADGLPADAWVGTDEDAPTGRTTRSTHAPLDRATRIRVLRVGHCLQCHDGSAPLYADFPASLAALKPACRKAPSR